MLRLLAITMLLPLMTGCFEKPPVYAGSKGKNAAAHAEKAADGLSDKSRKEDDASSKKSTDGTLPSETTNDTIPSTTIEKKDEQVSKAPCMLPANGTEIL